MTTPIRLMLTGGGTGGHLFPAIATADALCKRVPGSEVLFVGTKRRLDKTSLEHSGYKTCSIYSKGLKGKNLIALLQGILVLPISCIQAIYHILRFKPHLVVGVGGYVTGPVMVAARILGKPTLIHEQNSIPGLANRKLGAIVSRICVSLPGSEKWFPADKTVMTGNPVRSELLLLAKKETQKENEGTTILVLGGSLGAHRVNELVCEALSIGLPALANIKVIHQTGPQDVEEVKATYRKNNIDATVKAFITDMAAVYEAADLLISRAGATTLAEIAIIAKPAILIPYPYAADNHQEKNAQFYVDGGGAKMFVEKQLTANILAEELARLFNSPKELQEMGECMKNRAFPKAAEQIVDECFKLLRLP